jgi:hypothetical protein
VNEPAIPLRAADWAAVVAASVREIDGIGADWLVLSGTIPTVAEGGGLVDILELLRAAAGRGARVAVDTAGVALETAVATAAAWGALAVSSATTVLTSLDGAPLPIAVRDPDPATPLREPATPPRSEVEPR